jgi:hypothetical protein
MQGSCQNSLNRFICGGNHDHQAESPRASSNMREFDKTDQVRRFVLRSASGYFSRADATGKDC